MAEYRRWSERWESIACLATAETTVGKTQRLIVQNWSTAGYRRLYTHRSIASSCNTAKCINLMTPFIFHPLIHNVLENMLGSLLTLEIKSLPVNWPPLPIITSAIFNKRPPHSIQRSLGRSKNHFPSMISQNPTAYNVVLKYFQIWNLVSLSYQSIEKNESEIMPSFIHVIHRFKSSIVLLGPLIV